MHLRLLASLIPIWSVLLPSESFGIDEIWNMSTVREHPLNPVTISEREAPAAFADGEEHWMTTGDDWVERGGKSKPSNLLKPSHPEIETLLVEEHFIECRTIESGVSRIFLATCRPKDLEGPFPTILVFHGGGGHASGALALAVARRHPGMATVAMDYNGQYRPGEEGKVTEWVGSPGPLRQFEFDADQRNWHFFHVVIAARRTLDWMETQSWVDEEKIGSVGISYGGWVGFLLAGVDSRIRCLTTGVSSGGVEFTNGKTSEPLRFEPADQRAIWLEHYEPFAHAPRTEAAVFFDLGTNDYFFHLRGAIRHRDALPSSVAWRLVPNSNHGFGGPPLPDQGAPRFMAQQLGVGAPIPEVSPPLFTEGRWQWEVASSHPLTEQRCWISPGDPNSVATYWIELPVEASPTGGTAQLPEAFHGKHHQFIATAMDVTGAAVTSPVARKDGALPTEEAVSYWGTDSLWDVAAPETAWRTLAGWFPKTKHRVDESRALLIAPDNDEGEFSVATHSVHLCAAILKDLPTIELEVDGQGESGTLTLQFLHQGMSLDEVNYPVVVDYTAERTTLRLDLGDWIPEASGVVFDTLRLTGNRKSDRMLAIHSLRFAGSERE